MSNGQSAVSQSPDDAFESPFSPKLPASIQELPEDQRHELIEYFREIIHVEQTTGHMPPPGMLNAYSPEVQTNIVDEFVQHGQHRRTAEVTILDASIQRDRLGMWLGFVLAFSMIICGTAVILSGSSVEGLALIATDVLAISIVYVQDRRNRRE